MKKIIMDLADLAYKLRPLPERKSLPLKLRIKPKLTPFIDHTRIAPEEFSFFDSLEQTVPLGMDQYEIKLCDWFRNYYQRTFQIDLPKNVELFYSPDYFQLLSTFLMAFLDQEDTAFICDPGHPFFHNAALLTHCKSIRLPLTPRGDYLPNLKELEKNLYANSQILLLNYPHIPTGAVLDSFYIQELKKFAQAHNILILNDAGLIDYQAPTQTPVSFFTGGTKFSHFIEIYRFGLPGSGFAPSFLLATPDIMRPFRHFVGKTSLPPPPWQLAVSNHWLRQYAQLLEHLQNRIEANCLTAQTYFARWQWYYHRPAGGYYLYCKTPPGYSADGLALSLFRIANLRIIPGTDFGEYGENSFILNLLKDPAQFDESLNRIEKNWLPMKLKKVPPKRPL